MGFFVLSEDFFCLFHLVIKYKSSLVGTGSTEQAVNMDFLKMKVFG